MSDVIESPPPPDEDCKVIVFIDAQMMHTIKSVAWSPHGRWVRISGHVGPIDDGWSHVQRLSQNRDETCLVDVRTLDKDAGRWESVAQFDALVVEASAHGDEYQAHFAEPKPKAA